MENKIVKILLIILQILIYSFIAQLLVVTLFNSSVVANMGISINLPFGWPSWPCKSVSSQWGFPFVAHRCPPPEFWCSCYGNAIAEMLNFLFSLGIVYAVASLLEKLMKSLLNKRKLLRKNS